MTHDACSIATATASNTSARTRTTVSPSSPATRSSTSGPPATFDDEALDREPRIIAAIVETPIRLRVASVYVPHGRTLDHWHFTYKLAFLAALTEQARAWASRRPHHHRRRHQRRRDRQ